MSVVSSFFVVVVNFTSSPDWFLLLFFTAELDNMSSTERISFLQKKLQEIRKYYMSLKSEVASIDRRRKRLKKKEREGNLFHLIIIIYYLMMRIM